MLLINIYLKLICDMLRDLVPFVQSHVFKIMQIVPNLLQVI